MHSIRAAHVPALVAASAQSRAQCVSHGQSEHDAHCAKHAAMGASATWASSAAGTSGAGVDAQDAKPSAKAHSEAVCWM